MKRFIILALTFIVGVFVGVTSMLAVVQRGPNRVIATLARGFTSEQAIYGTLLYEKRYDDLQKLIESGFLTSLNFQKGMEFSDDDYRSSQKFVQGYFDYTGRPISGPIADHIRAIPKGKGADTARLADLVASQKYNSGEQDAAANP